MSVETREMKEIEAAVATFIAVLELCREKVIHLAGSDTDCTVECGDDAPDRINL